MIKEQDIPNERKKRFLQPLVLLSLYYMYIKLYGQLRLPDDELVSTPTITRNGHSVLIYGQS